MARVFRWFLIGLLVSVVGGVVVVLFMDDDEWTAIALTVARTVVTTYEFDGDFEAKWGWVIEVSARDLTFDSDDGRISGQFGSVSGRLDIAALLDRRLVLDSVQVADGRLTVQSAPEGSDPLELPVDLVLLDGHAGDVRIRFFNAEGVPRDFYLESMAIVDEREGLLRAEGAGAIDASSMTVEGRFGDLVTLFNPGPQGYPINLRLGFGSYTVDVEGSIDKPLDAKQFVFDLAVEAPTVNPFLNMQLRGGRSIGRLDLRTRAIGDTSKLSLEGLELDVTNERGLTINLDGRIDNLYLMSGVDLYLDALIDDAEVLGLVEQFDTADHLAVRGRIEAEEMAVRLSEANVELTTLRGEEINLFGEMMADLTPDGTHVELTLRGDIHQEDGFNRENRLYELIFELEKLDLETSLTITEYDVAIGNLRLDAGSDELGSLVLAGQIGSFPFGEDEVFRDADVELSFESPDAGNIGSLFEIDLGPLNHVSVSAKLLGSGDDAALKDFSFTASDPKIGFARVAGDARFDVRTARPLISLIVDAEGRIDSLVELGRPLGIELPDIGAIDVAGRITGSGANLELVGLEVVLPDMTGRIDVRGDATISRVDPRWALPVSVQVEELAPLLAVVGIDTQAPLGGLKGRVDIRGTAQGIAIEDVHVASSNAGPVNVSVSGRVASVALSGARPEGIDIEVKADTRSTDQLGAVFGVDAPDAGVISVLARLSDSSGTFDLDPLEVRVDWQDAPVLRASGVTRDLLTTPDLHWQGQIEAEPTVLLRRWAGQDVPDVGTLRGGVHLSNADGTLGIERMDLELSPDRFAEVHASGSFEDVLAGTGIDIDLGWRFTDVEAGSVAFSGTMTGALLDSQLDGAWVLGRSSIDTVASLQIGESRPRIAVNVSSAFVDTDQLVAIFDEVTGLGPPEPEDTVAEVEPDAPPAKLFSTEPLDLSFLDLVDLNVSVKIDETFAESGPSRDLIGKLAIESGNVTLDPFEIEFPDGQFEARFGLDRTDGNELMVQLIGRNMVLSSLLGPLGQEVGGNLIIDLDLTTSGASQAELAAGLNGWARTLLEDGHLPTRFVDLLAVDLLEWTINTAVAPDRRQNISCGIGKLSLTDGLIDIDTLVLQGPGLDIVGSGWVNLADETLDVVVVPKREGLVWMEAEPVGLTGNLADPDPSVEIEKVAVKEVASYTLFGWLYIPILWIRTLFTGSAGTESARCLYDLSEFDDVR